MTAPTKNFTAIADSAIDAESPITETLMTQMRDNMEHLEEWLGKDFAAAQNHNHDGVNSALVEVGGNLLRNGSFENGVSGSSDGWTVTNYTGGANAVQTTGAMHGKYCLALTSTVLANGGAYATSNEFLPCAPARNYFAHALLKASVANVSSKVEVIWYDSAQAQISISVLYTSTSTPTAATLCGAGVVSPATTAYAKVRVTGGIPATGSATGSIYLDGVVFGAYELSFPRVAAGTDYVGNSGVLSTSATSPTEIANYRGIQGGTIRCQFKLTCNNAGGNGYARIYKNGAAFGTHRADTDNVYSTYTEDLDFAEGDTLQVFAYREVATLAYVKEIVFGADEWISPPVVLLIGER